MSENSPQNPATSPGAVSEPVVTTCANCHTPMPAELRFCRNCGFRLGEGSAEYTETVRFGSAQYPGLMNHETPGGQPLVTSYGLSGAMATNASRRLRKKKRSSGMTWIFLALLIFFVCAAAFTAVIRPIRRAARGVPIAIVPTKLSYVGVDKFQQTDGGVTFDNVEPPGSPADKAGLVGGDIITNYDGHAVSDDDDLNTFVAQTPPGKTVDIVYMRDGEIKTTKLTTVSREEFRRLEQAFSGRPEGRGRFGFDDDRTEVVTIPGTNLKGVKLEPGSISASLPADMAGIKDGDIITEFDGVPIRTPGELTWRVRRAIPYSTVKVVLMRGNEKLEIPVKMGKQ